MGLGGMVMIAARKMDRLEKAAKELNAIGQGGEVRMMMMIR